MRNKKALCCVIVLMATVLAARAAQTEKLLCDFEQDSDLAMWDFQVKDTQLSDQHVTHGKKCARLAPGDHLVTQKLPRDWSGFDSLEIDVFVEGEETLSVSMLIGDAAWEAKRTYWNRHNAEFKLKPGKGAITIPVNGLYRGESGSHGRDLKTNLDPKNITLVAIDFNSKVPVFVDNVRLTKESRPDGILAFSFGPEGQAGFPGFTPITWNTIYGQNGQKAGLKSACGGANRGRDDQFPTRLYRNFLWFQENDNEFITDAPNGKCHVWMVFDDCGFWAGEQAHFHKRVVRANGKDAFVQDRGAEGPTDYLFRFESIEPKPGDDLWDLYVKDLFKPARFDADVTDGKLHIQCVADGYWNAKVASIVIYPDSIKADGEKWVTEVEERNKKEFADRAVFLGPKQRALDIPAEVKAAGYWLGFPSSDEDVSLADPPGQRDGKLQRTCAKGQLLAFTFAVRPLKDFSGAVKLTLSDLKGAGGVIPAAAADLRYVHNLTQRNASEAAYKILPISLRPIEGSSLKLGKDLTRQFWINVQVPADAKPGAYAGDVTLSAGELKLTLPVTANVIDVSPDEPDFLFGFFGVSTPNELAEPRSKTALLDVLTVLKRYGMNSLSGGPEIKFSGFDSAGKPQLDFAACDEYFRVLKQVGFTQGVYTYGGPAYVSGLHDGYTIGATGHGWERSGKSFKEVLQVVYGAVKEHGDKEGWPPIYYSLLDEPSVLEGALANLELHKAYHDAVPAVHMGGFYSVDWKHTDPLGVAIQNIFKNMQWSGLNLHTQLDIDKAREFGRELHIYNQASTRYSFGAYQWAEMHKGVKGRLQWHTLNLAGYQFFDLDGQEPDAGIINWGRREVIPTLALARCSEGAADFRLAVTLWNVAEKKKGTPEAKAAQDYLEEVSRTIPAGQRTAPAGFSDEVFRNTCVEHLKKLGVK